MHRIDFRLMGRGVLAALLFPLIALASPGNPLGPEFRVDAPGAHRFLSSMDVARSGSGNFVASWTGDVDDSSTAAGVYLRRYDASGAPLEAPRHVEGSDASARESVVAMNASGAYVVAWAQEKSHPYNEIFVRSYDAAGHATSPALQVSPDEGVIVNEAPAVAMAANGDFIVAWRRYDDELVKDNLKLVVGLDYYYSKSSAIVAQRFRADGTPLGKATRVVTGIRTEIPLAVLGLGRMLGAPAVAMHADGRYLVAWNSAPYRLLPLELRMQRFGADGKAQGQALLVHQDQWLGNPAVGMDAAGNAVIAWSSLKRDETTDILLRRYDAAGKALGAAVPAHANLAEAQEQPDLAVAPGGSFVICWQTIIRASPYRYDVWARRFGADGNPLAPEFTLGDVTERFQGSNHVAVDALGNPVFMWTYGATSLPGVRAQLFEGP